MGEFVGVPSVLGQEDPALEELSLRLRTVISLAGVALRKEASIAWPNHLHLVYGGVGAFHVVA